MTSATLLVELLTEELPPKSLARLAEAFRKALTEDLQQEGFLATGGASRAYATPRRLAVQITQVLAQSPDKALEIQGPSVKVGLDKDGKATPALAGFAKKSGVAVEDLVQIESAKGAVFACRKTATGSALQTNLAAKVEAVLKKLPVAKMMRWGDGDAEFVRPVHGLIMLHGASVVPGTVLGITSGNKSRGHRFMGQSELAIANADAYETDLAKDGMVIADFAQRRSMIDELLQAEAKKQQATLGEYQDLLDEVTALVEHPSVYVGAFDAGFLEVPAECLILTMRQNQKYFPLFDSAGKLSNRFLIVSNMQVADPVHIISGNQRVVRPRLEDARFFYNQDRKERLETRVPRLEKVVYHNKLGTQLQRVERVQLLAGKIARLLNADAAQAERAAWLAKADLVTGMVGEFPELQGIMGRYYALHDGEPAEVADAIAAHYQPRYAGDKLPESPVACSVALADKMETLAGMFGIGQLPTGDKDPFGLRRQALGIIRILIERKLEISFIQLIDGAIEGMPLHAKSDWAQILIFIQDRARTYFSEQGHTSSAIGAVLQPLGAATWPYTLSEIIIEASRFIATEDGKILAEANKRITNILKKSGYEVPFGVGPDALNVRPDPSLFKDEAEINLWIALQKIGGESIALKKKHQFSDSLRVLSRLGTPTKAFFESVMVNVEDPDIRDNRITLLQHARAYMNQVADLSLMAS